jgi:two-component system, OmpR family, sensor kinase
MASLRARVLASVLVLAAAGLIALAAVTYAEQSSFLQGRIDQEVKAAAGTVSMALDRDGFNPPGGPPAASGENDDEDNGQTNGGNTDQGTSPRPNPNGPQSNLPPGTYGERKSSSGVSIGATFFSFIETRPPRPVIPRHVPIERVFTVGSVGSSGLHYRVYVSHDPEDSGLTLVAVPLHEVSETLDRLLLVEGLVIVGVLLALAVSASFVVRLGLRPLDRMEITAGQIAAGELSRRVSPATERTEVGRLGLALNAMLDRLEEAFAARTQSEERLRRFLADASHELRTPLASIRGYAELFRMGATEGQAGTEMAMRRIEEESKRMGVLVEDLLTLARLDEAPELKSDPVDLAVLARDAVIDARATAPDRAIEIAAEGPAIVRGDAHQLRQVLANLTRNALVHTPAGTPIEVSLAQDDQTVTVTVRDHGLGLPATGDDSLFDRFWRTEGGRERGKAGAGLGLAIAHTVVCAHHGQITATNAPDGGAVFTVRLPKSPPEPDEPADGPAASSS